MDLIVGTGKVADRLPVALILGEPAVTLETEGLITGIVLHVDIAQVPARKYPCRKETWRLGAERALSPSPIRLPLPLPTGCVALDKFSVLLGLCLLVDEMKGWVRLSLRHF